MSQCKASRGQEYSSKGRRVQQSMNAERELDAGGWLQRGASRGGRGAPLRGRVFSCHRHAVAAATPPSRRGRAARGRELPLGAASGWLPPPVTAQS